MLSAANALLPPWVSLLLVVLIAWQLARIVWMLVPAAAPVDGSPVPASGSSGGPEVMAATDVNAIAATHIFGVASGNQPADTPPPAASQTDNLQSTRLTNLSLKGTIAAEPAERAVAIIADGRSEEKVYKVGDSVTSGASLHAVYRDRVILDENGVLRKLDLPREFPTMATSSPRRGINTSQRAVQETRSIQSVVAQNLSKLTEVIRPTPYFVNGQIEGYRVYPGRNRAQFAALGLRPGDLVKDIDGQALTDQAQAMQIFESLGTAEQVSVTVERNGQPEVLVLSTSQLEIEDESNQ